MPPQDPLPSLPSLPELRQELAELYGDTLDVFAGRHHARFIPEDVPQHIISRVLQEGEVMRLGATETRKIDVRVVAATNRNLGGLVLRHRFREDLYYRLQSSVVELPPLCDRGNDVLEIADHYLRTLHSGTRITKAGRNALLGYTWPGNIRELQSVLGSSIALSATSVIEAKTIRGQIELLAVEGQARRAKEQRRRRALACSSWPDSSARSTSSRLPRTPLIHLYCLALVLVDSAVGSLLDKCEGGLFSLSFDLLWSELAETDLPDSASTLKLLALGQHTGVHCRRCLLNWRWLCNYIAVTCGTLL